MATITFPVIDKDATCPVTYGDTFYTVETNDRETFSVKCPSCGDNRKISYIR